MKEGWGREVKGGVGKGDEGRRGVRKGREVKGG